MCRPEAEPGVRFRPDVKCCGFLPTLPNFLVGAVLSDPELDARSVRARIAAGQAGPLGLFVVDDYKERYAAAELDFGREISLICPHFQGGGCAIWRHRNAVCRTWWCKPEQGRRGGARWGALRRALEVVEQKLARHCAAGLVFEPGHEEDYFRACAARVGAMSAAEIRELCGFELRFRLRELREATRSLGDAPLPDPLTLLARDRAPVREGWVRLWGWSPYDPVDLPEAVEVLTRAGPRAVAELLEVPGLSPGLLRQAVDAGVLGSPDSFVSLR